MDFLDRFSKITLTPNLMKIRPVEARLFHADRQTDMRKQTVAYQNFANRLENIQFYSVRNVEVVATTILKI